MVRSTASLERQLGYYEAESDRLRATPDDAAWAEAQAVVAYANFIYDRIKRIDEEWSAELAETGAAPAAADADAVWNLYGKWCGKAEADLRRAAELDAKFRKVEGLDRLRQALFEARGLLSIRPDRVRQSAASVGAGRVRPLGDLRDGLQRKLEPGS